jgi:hypothetical protein
MVVFCRVVTVELTQPLVMTLESRSAWTSYLVVGQGGQGDYWRGIVVKTDPLQDTVYPVKKTL